MAKNGNIVWDTPVPTAASSGGITWDAPPTEQPEEQEGANPLKRVWTGFKDPFVGAAQLAAKTGITDVGLLPMALKKLTGSSVSENILDEYKDYGEDIVDPDGGMDWYRMGGSVANPINFLGPGKAKQGMGLLKYGADRLMKHGAANAAQGAINPVVGDADFVEQKKSDIMSSALLGTGMSGASKGVSGATSSIMNNFANAEGVAKNYLTDLFGAENVPEVSNILRNLKGNVEGEQPTIAWGGLEQQGRFPGLASLEHNARRDKDIGGLFNQRDAQNKAAQLRVMDDLIGEGADVFDETGRKIKTPVQKRTSAVTGPMYDAVAPERIHIPETKSRALDAASDPKTLNLQELNRIAKFTNDPAVGGSTGVRSVNQPKPDVMDPTMSGQSLDQPYSILSTDTVGSVQAKLKALDDQIISGKNPVTGEQISNLRNLQNTRRGMMDWLRKSSPGFAEASDTFKEMITPQNRADYVKVLRNAFTDETGGSKQLISAIDDAPGTARKAGLPMGADSTTQAMNSAVEGGTEAIDKINALRSSARRDVDVGNIMKTDLGKITTVGDAVDQYIPPLLNPVITSTKRLLKLFGGKTEEEVQAVLNKAALDPKSMADILDSTPPEHRNKMVNWIRSANKAVGRPAKTAFIRERIREEE